MRLNAFTGLLLLGLLAGQIALGQAPGSRAQVYAVPTTGEAGRFQVPQVRLPDAAVARRINAVLLREFRERIGLEVDSTRSPRHQVRQAAYACCYEAEAKSWYIGNGEGNMSATGYTVLLNQSYLLSLAFNISENGLEQPGDPHLTFDLRTGQVLKVSDLVADPPGQLSRRLGAAISRRLRADFAGFVEQYGDDVDQLNYIAMLYQLNYWDTTPQRGLALDMAADIPETVDDFQAGITNFALTANALLLFHPIGMPRTSFEFLPDAQYTFPWARLKLRERLQPLAKPAPTKAGHKKP